MKQSSGIGSESEPPSAWLLRLSLQIAKNQEPMWTDSCAYLPTCVVIIIIIIIMVFPISTLAARDAGLHSARSVGK